jgi:hypothetical protein
MSVVNVTIFLVPIAICFYNRLKRMVNINTVNDKHSFRIRTLTILISEFLSFVYILG